MQQQQQPQTSPPSFTPPPSTTSTTNSNNNNTGGMDPAQLHQLIQLLGNSKQQQQDQQSALAAAAAATAAATAASASAAGPGKQTAVVECPKSMVGRVIGKGGETIKALQQYTGAMIQIDQSTDPTRVTIAGSPQSLQLAVSMVSDIVRGTFKGFAMLRQISMASGLGPFAQPQPVYVQGYGFVPPSQVFSPEEVAGGAVPAPGAGVPPGGIGASPMLRSPPAGPLTPPITPLRANAPGMEGLGGGMPPETLAALLAGQGPSSLSGTPLPPPHTANMSQDALIASLLNQLAMQSAPMASAPMPMPMSMPMPMHMHMPSPDMGGLRYNPGHSSGLDQGAIQVLLAQAGLMGAGQAAAAAAGSSSGVSHMLPATTASSLPPSTSLLLSAQGTPAVLGQGGQSAFGSLGSNGGGHTNSGTASPTAPQHAQGHPSLGIHLGTSPSGTASPIINDVNGGGNDRYLSLSAATSPQLARPRPSSGESSPLGRFGAIGSGLGSARNSGGGAEEGEHGLRSASPGLASALPSGWADNLH